MRESDLIYQLGNQTLEVEKVWASFSEKDLRMCNPPNHSFK